MTKRTTRADEVIAPPPAEPGAEQKRPLSETQERHLGLLIWLTYFLCRRRGCADRWCQRSGHCRDMSRLIKRFAPRDGIDGKTSRHLLFALRAALMDARFPGQDPSNRRPGEDQYAATARWHVELNEEARRLSER